MQQNPDLGKNNIIVGPDYGQLIKQQTNSAIIEAFISMLFSKDTKFGVRTILAMVRNITILIIIKISLEESSSYIDKFRFTNLSVLKYLYQWAKYSERRYEFVLIGGKWKYESKTISINTLTPFLESKSIHLSQNGTYYYKYLSYSIKVIVSSNKITFAIPDVNAVVRYLESEVIHKNEEIMFGGKTIISKVMLSANSMLRIEPMQITYAFATENYLSLEESIRNYFLVDSIIKTQSVPFCINFDGEPGTGKTTFGSYIAASGIFNRIIVYNLVQATTVNFHDTINNLERQIFNSSSKEKKSEDDPEIILIILDEIDKWIESYISHQIHKLREEARIKKENIKKNESVSESAEKLTEKEEEEKRLQLRTEFLDQLYKLVDGHILSDTRKYVIIFNTNHFDALFTNVDQRYLALHDRFQIYKFSLSGKKEVITYILNIIEKLKQIVDDINIAENKRQIFSNVISRLIDYDQSLLQKIPDNILISYRSLNKIFRRNSFKIKETIEELCTLSGRDI